MEEVRKGAAEVARSIALLTPKFTVCCPHCEVSLKGNELVALDVVIDHFGYHAGGTLDPVPGPEQIKADKAMTQMIALPVHTGVSPSKLAQSAEDAKLYPVQDLYNNLVTLHNQGPHANAKTFVWGAGNPVSAKVLMIGEAPGWQEDKFGIPFIGDAGQVLSSCLHYAGIDRCLDALLINTVCLIPDRVGTEIGKPRTVDMLEQRGRVIEIIRLLQERPGGLDAVVCLGKYPWVQLVEKVRMEKAFKAGVEMNMRDISIGRVKGWHGDGIPDVTVPVLATFHPSYILRTWKGSGKAPSQIPEMVDYADTFKTLEEKIHGKRKVEVQ